MARGRGFEGHTEDLAGKLRLAASRSKDIATNIDRAKESWTFFGAQTTQIGSAIADLNDKLTKSKKLMLDSANSAGYVEAAGAVADLTKKIEKMNQKLLAVKVGDKLAKSFDFLGKSLAKLNAAIMAFGFGFLVDGIKRVYELQERWTRAIGEFNMKIGGMSAGLKGAQKAAGQWEGTVRGLTDQFGLGLQMFAEFTEGMSRMVEKGDEFSKLGLQLARGFNLGGQGAGKLSRSFESMGMSAGSSAVTMSELVQAANDAHVPVNMVAKDVGEANDYLVRFGKQGAKSFVIAAGYARKFGMSMKDLQKTVEGFDMLEGATTMAAKFNVAFGTAINGIDVLLEDDPARRMETFRDALLSQGQTFDRMSPKMRRMAADMLKVNETQLASLLSSTNAGFSYQKMLDKQEQKEKSELQAKAMMQKALAKTAQTMFAFGAAWDRITVAIGKAIRPLLETLGLAKSGGKEWKSFGDVMGNVFNTIEHFFVELSTNPKWMNFMKELAVDMKDVASSIKDWVMSGDAVKFIGKIVTVTRELYKWGKSAFETMVEWGKKLMPIVDFIFSHSKQILQVWIAMKGVNMIGGATAKLSGMLGGATTAGGRGVSAVGSVLGRGAIGAGIGSVTGDGAAGAIGGGIGSIAGGALGSMLGPVGGMIGTAVGGAVGGWLATKGSKIWDMWRENQESDEVFLFKLRVKDLNALREKTEKQFQMNSEFQRSIQELEQTRDQHRQTAFEAEVAALGSNIEAVDEVTRAHQELLVGIKQVRDEFNTLAQQQIEERKKTEQLELKEAEVKEANAKATVAGFDLQSAGIKDVNKRLKEYGAAQDAAQTAVEDLARSQANMARVETQILRAKHTVARFEADYVKFAQEHATEGLNEQQMRSAFFVDKKSSGQINEQEFQNVVDFYNGNISRNFASGGIVRKPTRALIGENGPEAVIPLRSMASGKPRLPRKVGGDSARSLVNYAAGKSGQSSSNSVTFVAGDVYLDGAKVGRHIVREALSGRD